MLDVLYEDLRERKSHFLLHLTGFFPEIISTLYFPKNVKVMQKLSIKNHLDLESSECKREIKMTRRVITPSSKLFASSIEITHWELAVWLRSGHHWFYLHVPPVCSYFGCQSETGASQLFFIRLSVTRVNILVLLLQSAIPIITKPPLTSLYANAAFSVFDGCRWNGGRLLIFQIA